MRRLRTQAGLTQAAFAERLLVSRDYISQIENGREPGPRLVQQLELLEKVGIVPADRVGKMGDAAVVHALREEPAAYMAERAVAAHQVPVVSWARAGSAAAYDEIPRDWQRTVYTTCSATHAFAIEIEGDSMVPDFRAGDIVVVMPEQEPRNHHPVVAKLKSDGVVLKILNLSGRDGRTIRLSSLNPAYQPIDYAPEDFHWMYPVHSSQRVYWR